MEKLLLYCTKATPYLVQGLAKPMHTLDANNPYNFNWKVVKKGFSNDRLNGKIVAECDCDLVEEIKRYVDADTRNVFYTDTEKDISDKAVGDLFNSKYAFHLSNIKLFSKPKNLSDFLHLKQPRGMTIVFDKNGNRYILIPMKSDELCDLLNGNASIVVKNYGLQNLCK